MSAATASGDPTLERQKHIDRVQEGDVLETENGHRGEVTDVVEVGDDETASDAIGEQALLMDADHAETADRIALTAFDHGVEPFAESALLSDVNERGMQYYRTDA